MKVINWTKKLKRVGTLGYFPIKNITKLIVHHDAQIRPNAYDNFARWNAQAKFHISKGQGRGGIQYHFIIDNIGQVYQVNPLGEILYHAGNLTVNKSSIAIKLDGYFHAPHNQKPTTAQLKGLEWLLGVLSADKRFPANRDDVYAHREVSYKYTACPGDTLTPWVKKYRKTKPAPPPVPPAPPKPSPVVKRYVRYAAPKLRVFVRNANLWDFNKTGWDFKAIKSFKKGEPFFAVGEAKHSNGSTYLMTLYSFGQADKTGVPTFTHGVNGVDLVAKPTPAPSEPATPSIPPEKPSIPETPPTEIPPEDVVNDDTPRKEVLNLVDFILGFLKRLSSRKFLLTLGTVISADTVVEGSGLSGDVAGVFAIIVKVGAVITYIIVEGLKDIQEVKTPQA